MRVQRMGAIAALGLVALLGAAGCGGSDRGGAQSASAPEVQNQAPADLGAPGGAGDAAQQSGTTGSGAQPAQQVQASQRHVVRTAQLSIEVGDVYEAARKVYAVGARFGGFVADEKTDEGSASIELKVNADELDTALGELSELGTKVVNRSQQAKDVTEQVVDLQSRIASQRASVERIRALLADADALDEIVQIESELTRRQADLESLEQRAATLGGQAELATVTVTLLKPDAAVVPEDDEDMGFLAGLGSGWRVFLASTMVLLTVLGALLPFALLVAVPLAVVMVLRRRRSAGQAPTAPAAPTAGS